MTVYVVTNPELGWDCVVGVFTDKDYVYSKYDNRKYVIHSETLQDTKWVEPDKIDLSKFGRTDFKYKVVNADRIKTTDMFESDVYSKDGTFFSSYNIIDPEEGEHVIKFDGKEQPHTVENLSVIADLFCDFTKIEKDAIRIFSDGGSYYLGSIVEFPDSKELWASFKKKGVELYY
jgi:hypothetical protein